MRVSQILQQKTKSINNVPIDSFHRCRAVDSRLLAKSRVSLLLLLLIYTWYPVAECDSVTYSRKRWIRTREEQVKSDKLEPGRASICRCCCFGARVKGPAGRAFPETVAEDPPGGYGGEGLMERSGHGNLPILPSEASDSILEDSWGFDYMSRRVDPSDMVYTHINTSSLASFNQSAR